MKIFTSLAALACCLLLVVNLQAQDTAPQPYKQLTRINNQTKKANGKAVYVREEHQDQSRSYRIETLKEGKLTTKTHLEYTRTGSLGYLFFEDFKKDFSLSMHASSGIYTIDYKENNKAKKTFSIKKKQLVTLPELEFYLMHNFELLLEQQTLNFTLFFPNMLAKSTSLSYFDFEAKPTKKTEEKLKIEVQPRSAFVKMLLPSDKKKLHITFLRASKQAVDISFGKYSYIQNQENP